MATKRMRPEGHDHARLTGLDNLMEDDQGIENMAKQE